MYLSRIRLDLNGLSRDTLLRVLAGEAYTAHQLLWQLFSDAENSRPFLFRQEIEDEQRSTCSPKGLPLFYVLSECEPATTSDLLNMETKRFEPQLEVGDRLAFRLRANPTVTHRREDGARGQRSDVLMNAKHGFAREQRASLECKQAMDTAAADWLKRRSAQFGFEMLGAPEIGAYRQHEIAKRNTGDIVKFSSVDYAGRVAVTDPERLLATLAAGIGRAKAFGCGLMMIRRA